MANILIIEDDDTLRSTLEERLRLEGFRVQTVSCGEDGVQQARKEPPDLILCDITMPGLDGYGVLRALQTDPQTAVIPFVFLTAKATPLQVRVGMGVGADDYLCKPIGKEELLVAIRARLWKHQQRQERLLQTAETARLGVVRKLPQELLTPLTGLLSVVQLLESTQTVQSVAEVRQLGQVLHTAAARVQRTTRRFLLAELEVANHRPQTQVPLRGTLHLPATAWVSALAEHLAWQHARKGDLSLELADVEVVMTVTHFSELVGQLVDNAFKFSPPGRGVQILLDLRSGDACELTVRDRGCGLAPEEIQQLKVSQAAAADLWAQPVNSLGLALVQQIVDLYGGTFALESELGQGTQARVRLPRARPGTQRSNPLEPELLQRIASALHASVPEMRPDPASAALDSGAAMD